MPRFAQSALVETLRPPLRKKNGVRKANETTRNRSCSIRCEAKNCDIARPRMNTGRAVCEFARWPSHMRRNRQANTSLISGSITRFPYRGKKSLAARGSPKMSAIETSANGTIQIVGFRNRTVRPVTVAMSVTNVANMSATSRARST
jgi:hypothetical protein